RRRRRAPGRAPGDRPRVRRGDDLPRRRGVRGRGRRRRDAAVVSADAMEAVIGLEVHAELLTRSKIFCGCSATFGGDPNANVCPVCLGMPGVLPVLNRRVVEFAVRAGLAAHCTIATASVFARKNYFYPDICKGYQISQYELPICVSGWLDVL